MPLVSIVVPIYNAQDYLHQAIRSLRSQTLKDIEIICLNDGSTDRSLDIIQSHAAQDNRIVVVDKQNEGYGATCNRGIDMASGEWIAILEPDDWFEPDAFKAMTDLAEATKQNPDVVKCPYWRIVHPDTDKQMKLACHYKRAMRKRRHVGTIKDMPELLSAHPSIWSAIYRKSFLDENGIRFLPIPGAGWADSPFMAETLCQAGCIVYFDTAYYCYREDPVSKMNAFFKNNPLIPIERWCQVLDAIERANADSDDVLIAHYQRGFSNLGSVLAVTDSIPSDVDEAITDMMKRMKPSVVAQCNFVSPAMAQLYQQHSGNSLPKGTRARHLAYNATRTADFIANLGVRNTLDLVAEKIRP